jgi:L-threonylcarbamoyladenylate synthase
MQMISNCTDVEVKKAAKALKDGHLVAFPTETVYGLGADANNSKAVARIYEVKERPTDHPLIVHISSINQISKWAIDIPDYAITLARKFWPGPMTLILSRSDLAQDYITGGQDTVGVRIPSHPVALALLSEFENLGGRGVAAPSANRFGAVSPTSAEAVNEELSRVFGSKDLLLGGGICKIGIESTIVDCTSILPRVLRPGFVTNEMIQEVTSLKIDHSRKKNMVRASGLMKSHYSPRAKIEIGSEPLPGDGFIALETYPTPEGVIRLAAPKTIEQYANTLYKAFRTADQNGILRIKIAMPAGNGLAAAIRDRIKKAAHKF